MKKKQILIVEDEVIVAQDLSNILKSPNYNVCGLAHSYDSAIDLFKKVIPDLIICDINLGNGKSGIDFIMETKKIKNVPVIFLTAYADEETVSGALETMPQSYLTKPFTEEQILISVNRVLRNNSNRGFQIKKIRTHVPTRRELEIIHFIALGDSSREIADKLCISFETVQSHRKNIFHKYSMSSSAELIAFAHKNKWLSSI